jgi:L-lactate dehydrogenase
LGGDSNLCNAEPIDITLFRRGKAESVAMPVDERKEGPMPTQEPKERFEPMSNKIAIVGAGRVGTTYAYTLLQRGLVGEIALIDVDTERARGEAMDLGHAAPLLHPVRICSGTYDECSDANIVMIAAGVAQRTGETRLELLKRNAAVFEEAIPRVVETNPRAILLIATNPVDIMSYVAWKLSGLPAERVIGSGTVLDSARLRHVLSQRLEIDPRNVHAYVIGEHGDSEVAVWSRAFAAGLPLDAFCERSGCTMSPADRDDLLNQTRNAAYEIIKRKGATYYAVAASLLRISESILMDQRSVLTVSTRVPKEYGLGDIYLSLPCVVGRRGATRTLEIPLDRDEDVAVHRSAEILQRSIAGMGYAR